MRVAKMEALSRSVRLLDGTVLQEDRSGAVFRVSQGNGECALAGGSGGGQAAGRV